MGDVQVIVSCYLSNTYSTMPVLFFIALTAYEPHCFSYGMNIGKMLLFCCKSLDTFVRFSYNKEDKFYHVQLTLREVIT